MTSFVISLYIPLRENRDMAEMKQGKHQSGKPQLTPLSLPFRKHFLTYPEDNMKNTLI